MNFLDDNLLSRDCVEAFLIQEANLLDERRFEEWMELFTPDGMYWAPARPDQSDALTEISLIYDDREAMRTRIRRLEHPRIHVQTPPSRTVRSLANIVIEERKASDGALRVRSKFFMYEYRPSLPEPLERIFAGTCRHHLVIAQGEIKILLKQVNLANCDGRFSPIAMYF